jgi:hypothetical protein
MAMDADYFISTLKASFMPAIREAMASYQSKEEIARLWLSQESKCAIDWLVLEELCAVYREHGAKELVFVPDQASYIIR